MEFGHIVRGVNRLNWRGRTQSKDVSLTEGVHSYRRTKDQRMVGVKKRQNPVVISILAYF